MCQLCQMDLDLQTITSMKNCSHIFHKKCLKKYFKSELELNHIPIMCPIKNCKSSPLIEISFEPTPVVEEKLGKKFMKYNTVVNSKSKTHRTKPLIPPLSIPDEMLMACPSPDCGYAFAKPANADFTCQECLKRFCLNCNTLYHFGMTCNEYEISANMRQLRLQQTNQFSFVGDSMVQTLTCPSCKTKVERTQQENDRGNRMVCKCRYQFCFMCSDQWPIQENGKPVAYCSCIGQ